MMFEDSLNMDGFQLESAELFSDSALGDFFTQDYELLNDSNSNSNSNNAMEDNGDVLGKIVLDLAIPVVDEEQEQEQEEEELKTAGIGVTEDPFFAETSKAANLFQNIKKEHQNADPTQSLIEEMEEFLQQHQEQDHSNSNGSIIDEEEAKKLLEALMKEEAEDENPIINDQTELNSVSRLVDQNGQEIIIVIANENDDEYQNIPSNSNSFSSVDEDYKPEQEEEELMDSEDSDWSPAQDKRRSTKRANAGRHSKYIKEDKMAEVKKKGRGRNPKSIYHGVKDKKERKKLQNVVAARRYRDKKKNEVFKEEMEEEKLKAKNDQLKNRLSEIEGEVKTLKKLVVELGLVKKATFKQR